MPAEQSIRQRIGTRYSDKSILYAELLIALLYVGGTVFTTLPQTKAFALSLTPVHLVLCTALLLYFHPVKDVRFWWFCGVCFVAGLGIEIIGIDTGAPFGVYSYGSSLGPKFQGAPLVIGVNWLLLVYLFNQPLSRLKLDWWYKSTFGAVLLVGFDALIEPRAMALGYWHWPGGLVDPDNYYGWFLTGTILSGLFHWLIKPSANPIVTMLIGWNIWFLVILRA